MFSRETRRSIFKIFLPHLRPLKLPSMIFDILKKFRRYGLAYPSTQTYATLTPLFLYEKDYPSYPGSNLLP